MFFRGRTKQKGVSLIELMVSIMIFTTALMAFAMVFPSGYRLNYKTRMESRAAKTAEGLVQQIMNLPWGTDPLDSAKPTIVNLNKWSLTSAYRFKTDFEDKVPAPFYLEDAGGGKNTPQGIVVYVCDSSLDGGTGTLAKIEVNVSWQESSKARTLYKYVTVSAYRSKNHE